MPLSLALILLLLSALSWLIEKRKGYVFLYIVVAVGGGISEIVAIFFGAWKYSLANVAGIPMWLPLVWGLSALHIQRAFFAINALFSGRNKKKNGAYEES